MKNILATLVLNILFSCFLPVYSQSIPHLEKRGNATQLIVDGKPFLVLGGELHNSSSSNSTYLNALWQPIKKMNLNTVLAAVSWELTEPKEGVFDFSLVDAMLKGARENQLKLILLWFGSWKNGLSHYAPAWVKTDQKRFPRIMLLNGKSTETITALSEEAMKADAKAFAALMKHLKETDAKEQTVIMVQVENEVGVIGDTRDHSPLANAAFNKAVPSEFLKGLQKYSAELNANFKKNWEANGSKTAGNWAAVFGNNSSADEAFMAWHYARYINAIAQAGKAEYNLPMFVNAWIVQPEDRQPGDYPGGGPQAHVHDIWRIAAPAVDIKAPDIYLPDFKGITAQYYHNWNPLFIPESFSGFTGAANAFYAIGKYNGIGYSPFGIDGRANDSIRAQLAKAYNILAGLTPEITQAQAAGSIIGISLQKSDSLYSASLGGYEITVGLRKNWAGVAQASRGYGIIIHTGNDAFTIAGSNIDVKFSPVSPGPKTAGLLSVEERQFENGVWKGGRMLNGDDIMMSYKLADEAAANRTGTGARLLEDPQVLKVKLYRFE